MVKKMGDNREICGRVGRFIICIPVIFAVQTVKSFSGAGSRLHTFCQRALEKIEDFIVGGIS